MSIKRVVRHSGRRIDSVMTGAARETRRRREKLRATSHTNPTLEDLLNTPTSLIIKVCTKALMQTNGIVSGVDNP